MFDYDKFIVACGVLRENKTSFIICTLLDKQNSVPQDIGSKMLVTYEGLYYGTIGGGSLEKLSIDLSKEYLEKNDFINEIKYLDLRKDFGMICGGKVTVLFEKVSFDLAWKITVFGAGHVSQALCKILVGLECDITCIDTRQEWLDKLPTKLNFNKVLVEKYTDFCTKVDAKSFIVIMTTGHEQDFLILKELLQKNSYPYIGVIGSESKRKQLDNALLRDNIKGDFICPIGEKIGNNQANEIAISIVAQLLRYKDL
jgi:xanthine dehydrogenase accessory factor